MPDRSSKLKIVSNNNAVASTVSRDIGNAVLRWKQLQNKLTTLIEQQDAALVRTANDSVVLEQLKEDIKATEREQIETLARLVQQPGRSLHDVVAKLEVWNWINSPDHNTWANPADHLISSALFDLQQKVDTNL